MNESMTQALAPYFALMNGNAAAQVYRGAVQCGVLPTLCQASLSQSELALRLQLNPLSLELLLKTLQSLGLAIKIDDKFEATMLTKLLLGSDYRSLGDQYWAHFTEFLKSGEPMAAMDDMATSEAHYAKQAQSLGWMLSLSAREWATKVVATLGNPPLKILDLAAGAAVWSLSLASANSNSHVTVVDWPAVVTIASQTAQQFGLTHRFSAIAGNLFEVALDSQAYDVVVLANIIHLQSDPQVKATFELARRAVKPTGHVAVIDVYDRGAESTSATRLYELGLALRTRQGRIRTIDSVSQHLQESGFSQVTEIALESPPGVVAALLGSN